MDRREKAVFTGVLGVGGAVLLLALTVYPLDYGVAESSLLVGLLVLFGLYETVLGDAL